MSKNKYKKKLKLLSILLGDFNKSILMYTLSGIITHIRFEITKIRIKWKLRKYFHRKLQ